MWKVTHIESKTESLLITSLEKKSPGGIGSVEIILQERAEIESDYRATADEAGISVSKRSNVGKSWIATEKRWFIGRDVRCLGLVH
jgi:hypothetical protein